MAIVGVSTSPATAGVETKALVARPAVIDFKTKHVGTENYKRTRITNRSDAECGSSSPLLFPTTSASG